MSSVWDELSREQNEERVRVLLKCGTDSEDIAKAFPEYTLDEIHAIEEQMMALAPA